MTARLNFGSVTDFVKPAGNDEATGNIVYAPGDGAGDLTFPFTAYEGNRGLIVDFDKSATLTVSPQGDVSGLWNKEVQSLLRPFRKMQKK